jgi:hypothetical protein
MSDEKPGGQGTDQVEQEEMSGRQHLARKLDAVGWGLFFIWVGIAFLADLGMGIGLLGVGVITLGGQAARRRFGLSLEGFWVVVGVLFLAGGLWTLFEAKVALVPLLLIVAGLAVLFSAFWGKRPSADDACDKWLITSACPDSLLDARKDNPKIRRRMRVDIHRSFWPPALPNSNGTKKLALNLYPLISETASSMWAFSPSPADWHILWKKISWTPIFCLDKGMAIG